jgi:type II secretory ATPase GspE/PulE/Tfp pilus assembly ATPase PilB-like protein
VSVSADGLRQREGLLLKSGLGRREFVPFDEVRQIDGATITLTSGTTRRVPATSVEATARALDPPSATGQRDEDGRALSAYVTGDWSPVRAAGALLSMAASCGASDVHLEARTDRVAIRLRVTGALEQFTDLEPACGVRLVAALKHLAGCLPYRSDLVQEGRVPRHGVAADVRASFMPTALGERAALRLFGRLWPLQELGLTTDLFDGLERLLDHRSGLVLIAGPSGGGKTTTVYGALDWLACRRSGAHLSIEDPVEQRLRMAGIPVDQVELCPERGLTAEVALVGALRQDVDVIALAEVRSAAEAALALQAAHTGRLVLAGIHAGSAREARQRMLDLEADPAVLDATLRGVLHQRLEAVECPNGAAPSCPTCHGTGRTRKPRAELWLNEGSD